MNRRANGEVGLPLGLKNVVEVSAITDVGKEMAV